MGNATFIPLHGIRDTTKFESLVESFRIGSPVPPVAVMGESALSGSHRIAAHQAAFRSWSRGEEGWEGAAEPKLDTIEVGEEDYLSACRVLGIDHHGSVEHFDLFASALLRVTSDSRLKECLADQCGDYEGCSDGYFAWYAETHS